MRSSKFGYPFITTQRAMGYRRISHDVQIAAIKTLLVNETF
jgi:hypothetical protein